MNKSLLLLTILAAGIFAATDPAVEEGVYVLTDSNFDDFIASKEFVLVEFYAPWCGHCKKLAPEFASAAGTLATANSNAVLAKVDATVETSLGGRFGVTGFPTIKFFTGTTENPVDFNGGRTAPEIITWINKKSGPLSKLIETPEELAAQISAHQVVVVYYGNLTYLPLMLINYLLCR